MIRLVLALFLATTTLALPLPNWIRQIGDAIFGAPIKKCGIIYDPEECSRIGDIQLTPCDNDAQCNGTICCNNGCLNVCGTLKNGPGYLWLPGEDDSDVSCRGNTLLGEQLFCPDSFWCLVIEIGDVSNGIPAKGICKPEEEAEKFLTRIHIQ